MKTQPVHVYHGTSRSHTDNQYTRRMAKYQEMQLIESDPAYAKFYHEETDWSPWAIVIIVAIIIIITLAVAKD